MSYDILVRRNDLNHVETRVRPAADAAGLGPDRIVCRIEQYAFTANNITYGVAGDTVGYWKFYPTNEADMGRLPVWGFATVSASQHPDVPVGERLYGYWPMSSDVVLTAGQVSAFALVDVAAHRKGLPVIYNRYARLSGDKSFAPGSEPFQALFRPLFMTSFLIDDFLDENGFFGADTVVVASASSKTAIGLAAMLERRKALGVQTVGLTSAANAPFVQRLGLYDKVLAYDEIKHLKAPGGAVLVDMAGATSVLSAVHFTLKDDLKFSCRVGFSHWQDAAPPKGLTLPGPRPIFFFAPDRAQKRMKDWGAAEFMQRTGGALAGFIGNSARWLKIERVTGPDAILSAYRETAAGRIKPETGLIFVA